MPVSEQPLVERIARVLAGAALSSNAEGSDPSAGEKVDLAWPEHVNQALAVLHTMREPDEAHGRGRRCRDVANMVEAAIARTRRLSPRDARGRENARGRPALDAGRLRPRLEPVVRRRLGPQRRLPAIRASYGAGAAAKCSGWSTPICCRCRRCCCSAERSATISGGGACWSSAPSLFAVASLRLRAGAEPADPARRARRAGHRRGLAAAQQPRAAQRRLRRREARPRGRHLGRGRRSRGGGRAADRRLAGRHRRLAGDLLHQPAAGARRDPARAALRRRKAASAGAGRTDYAGALLATAGLGGLTYALTLWSATRRFDRSRR